MQRRQFPQTSVYKSFAETAHRRPTIGSQRAEASRSQCSSTEQTNYRHTDYIFAETLLSEYHCLWGHSRCCVVLQGLSFAVFGLGNRQYEHFAAVGKRLQKALAALGATPVCRRGDGDDDDDIDADFEAWQAELLTALDKSPLMPAPKVRRCCYRRFREFGAWISPFAKSSHVSFDHPVDLLCDPLRHTRDQSKRGRLSSDLHVVSW